MERSIHRPSLLQEWKRIQTRTTVLKEVRPAGLSAKEAMAIAHYVIGIKEQRTDGQEKPRENLGTSLKKRNEGGQKIVFSSKNKVGYEHLAA